MLSELINGAACSAESCETWLEERIVEISNGSFLLRISSSLEADKVLFCVIEFVRPVVRLTFVFAEIVPVAPNICVVLKMFVDATVEVVLFTPTLFEIEFVV
jgi:hypothetical protein